VKEGPGRVSNIDFTLISGTCWEYVAICISTHRRKTDSESEF
jgi:hypothetical protein